MADALNPYETKATSRLMRLEYLVALGVSLELFIMHLDEVRWLPAVLLFLYIDLIGYIPGAIAYRRSRDGRIHKGYYIAYNLMHSLATQAAVAGLWVWWYGFEWALLVLPIHLFGDRALFGNSLKPFALSFEPKAHPAYVRLRDELQSPQGITGTTAVRPATGGRREEKAAV
ncbi:hypothetical protein QWM81_24070 [Streptomyces ficellus]|uniref:DUF4260 family protein n=1 Tax=Streptomyces ficellus TaxID=1977088 RepID=A0ABT7ZC26_9ACTN|nr:hypothetical protein [Streptomyces ficellus]MDN3297066.1 hypothetical protein [Streptomyces ficellus]